MADAAYAAHLRGASADVKRFLDILETGYNTEVRRAVLEDEIDLFVTVEVASARAGDFSTFKESTAD